MKTLCARLLPGVAALLATTLTARAQFTYTTTNGAITITGYTGPGGGLIVPGTINGLPVTSIGANAFSYGGIISSIVIPNSVTNIGDYAFLGCYNLTNVSLGSNVLSIGAHAFSGDAFNADYTGRESQAQACPLTSITIPDSVTNIGNSAFAGCPLVAIEVAVGNPAYRSVAGVLFNRDQTTLIEYPGGLGGSYAVPNSVADIGDYAFFGCSSLTNVVIGTNVTTIGAYAFSGPGYDGSSLGPGAASPQGCPFASVTIPESVVSVGDGAFAGCFNLTNVIIPNSVSSVGDYAFYNCSSLTNVTIGTNVTTIGAFAFSGVGYGDGGPGGPQDGQVFQIGSPLSSVTISSSVTNIGDSAFEGCYTLASAYFQGNPPSLGGGVFEGTRWYFVIYYPATASGWTTPIWNGYSANPYSGYTASFVYSISGSAVSLVQYIGLGGALTIPSSISGVGTVTSIGDYAFADSGLTNVTIPNSVTSIGASAFEECWALTSITIPDSVTSIGDYAFAYSGLTTVYFQGNAPTADSTVFSGYDATTAYYLPGTSGWAAFATNTGIPTAFWTLPYPLVLQQSVGVQSNGFGFTVSWATNLSAVVEASMDWSKNTWTPIQTNALHNGVVNFTDPDWTNYPSRFYRVRRQ